MSSVHAGWATVPRPAVDPERHDARALNMGRDRGVTTQVTTQILDASAIVPRQLSRGKPGDGAVAHVLTRVQKNTKKNDGGGRAGGLASQSLAD